MRFALVGLVASAVFGSVAGFQWIATRAAEHRVDVGIDRIDAHFELQVELTFEPTGDPFQTQPFSILVNGVSQAAAPVAEEDGYVYRFVLEKGWREGQNRLHFEAVGSATGKGPSRAAHLRLWRNGVPLRETVMWAPAGEPVMGSWTFDLELRGEAHE